MNVAQATLRDLFNAEIEGNVADLLQDSIAIAVEETFMDGVRLVTDSLTLQKKSTLNGRIDVPIYRLIKSGRLDSYFGTRPSNLAD